MLLLEAERVIETKPLLDLCASLNALVDTNDYERRHETENKLHTLLRIVKGHSYTLLAEGGEHC